MSNTIFDDVQQIVEDVFTAYGYATEANYGLVGLQKSLFSNVLLLDMPDHIT